MSQYQRAEDIALDLTSRLATITVANGYETDIGLRVFRGARKVADEQVPCAVLIEGADGVEQAPGRIPNVKVSQGYVLGGYAQCDVMNPNDMAHKIIRDLKRAIFTDDTGLGGKVSRIGYRGRDIGPRTDGVPIVFALIEIDVNYVEDLRNP